MENGENEGIPSDEALDHLDHQLDVGQNGRPDLGDHRCECLVTSINHPLFLRGTQF